MAATPASTPSWPAPERLNMRREPHVPKGYIILTEAIHDRDGMDAYGAASMASLVEYGGRVLVVDEDVDVLEGTWHGNRTVVVEYESVDTAREWYESESYRAALPLRQAAADCNVVIASGFVLRGSGEVSSS
jgi:uncharacterized protein (DUF1330 family)